MSLRDDAIQIWKAGVAAVDSAEAVRRAVQIENGSLVVAGRRMDCATVRRFLVVGAGKAGAGMARGLESQLRLLAGTDRISGWVNVPDDCVQDLDCIRLFGARPPGLNEPTSAAVCGTEQILHLMSSASSEDVCFVLISGGASALLCQPARGISLADKLAVTRALAASGAPIQELNLVRTELSQVKGGKLAAACRAGVMISLIISDVIGDPLSIIGSGPTVPTPDNAAAALTILERRTGFQGIPPAVIEFLRSTPRSAAQVITTELSNHIVASNRIAVEAAGHMAAHLGYDVVVDGSDDAGEARECGQRFFKRLRQLQQVASRRPVCLLNGGEPTVQLSPRESDCNTVVAGNVLKTTGKGGRNQEFVLAAINQRSDPADWEGLVLLSGGTDGEDGPTDAAGAVADSHVAATASAMNLVPRDYLRRHDSWHFFQATGGLLTTGPTHTNVMDLRVGLSQPRVRMRADEI